MRAAALGLLVALQAMLGAAGPAAADGIAVTGATIHPVTGPPVPDGTLVAVDGRILAVGPSSEVALPASVEAVDGTGMHLWPGLVDAMSRIGLTEIGSVEGTVDLDETGQMNPNARAEVAVNASSSHIPVTRANGILLAATVPGGSLVPGTAAAIALDGWTWEEMVRAAPVGLVIQWPAMNPEPRPGETKEAAKKKGDRPAWEKRIARLDDMIVEARAYVRARNSTASDAADVRWESLRSVVSGETPVWIETRTVAQMRAALDWTARHGLRMVLVDGSGYAGGEAWRLADALAERDVPVIVQTTRLPSRRYAPYDAPFAEPAKLHAAGVRIAFGTWDSANARNLPQEAARAAAFGLPVAAAERALTLGACEVLGIDDRYGSLEPGKSATMILVEGPLLETRMHVRRAWIDGNEVDLESRHTRLWKKWSARPRPESRAVDAEE
jgi:imidazolonepropionase-like amidohydrolase